MNISSRCEYGCRAVLELALHEHEEQPLTAHVIAQRRSIPEKYLVHILLQLKRTGIVRSIRGARGGYLLAQPSESITLFDVVSAVDGPIFDPLPVNGPGSDELAPAWAEVAAGVAEVLKGVSIQSIRDKHAKSHMYYI